MTVETFKDVLPLVVLCLCVLAIMWGRRRGQEAYHAAMQRARAEGHAEASAELRAQLGQHVTVVAGNSGAGPTGHELSHGSSSHDGAAFLPGVPAAHAPGLVVDEDGERRLAIVRDLIAREQQHDHHEYHGPSGVYHELDARPATSDRPAANVPGPGADGGSGRWAAPDRDAARDGVPRGSSSGVTHEVAGRGPGS